MATHFTREEAEALLPRLRTLLHELQLLRAELGAQEEAYATSRRRTSGNGHNTAASAQRTRMAIATSTAQLTTRLHTIAEMGVQLKDLDMGLVDFPSTRHGEDIYLCWHLAEPHVAYWHDTDHGFASRQPIDDDD